MQNVSVGDSLRQQGKTATDVAEKIVLLEIYEKYGLKLIDFESEHPIIEKIEILGMPLEMTKKQNPRFKVPQNTMTNFISYMSEHFTYKIIKKILI